MEKSQCTPGGGLLSWKPRLESNLAQDEPWDQLADITLVGMTPGLPLPDLLDIVRAAAPQVIAVTAISAAETRDDDARPDTVWP